MILAGLFLAVANTAWSEEPQNLFDNGGFERWAPLPASAARQPAVANVRLVPEGTAPVGFTPMREISKNPQRTGVVAMDERVRHAGQRSVRLENGDMRDISLVQYSTEPFTKRPDDPRNIRPNRRYALRWWVKGEQVDPRGSGPVVMMYTVSVKDGKSYRTNDSVEPPHPKGAFDWQSRQLIFVTDAYARWCAFSFQLRWTTGTAWYDDVTLVDLGPVVQVETY
jgi:hypothetical protein